MEYEPIIGLETHVQLKTQSKMWCGCANQYGAEPNTQVCPVCLGMPGVLPVPNEEALRLTALTGYLLHCELPGHVEFDRKNYFYPDVAKNYQLTQLAHPSTLHGYVDFEMKGEPMRVRITRAHLEEDVGKSFHFDRQSGVDFNRGGVPLLEIVSEPDITSADMAHAYLNALKDILVYGKISDCDMEKGMVRCDVNISVRPKGSSTLGAKVEIKNMNSFSGVRRALQYEIPRQLEAIRNGETIHQETRRWDDVAGITESMRTKEDAHDYRYFPCPDLVPFEPSKEWFEQVQQGVVELPLDRKKRFMDQYQLPDGDAEVFVNDVALGDYFEETAQRGGNPKALANWVINNLLAELNERSLTIEECQVSPEKIGALVDLVEAGQISNNQAKEVFADLFASPDREPADIAKEKGFEPADSGEVEGFINQAIADNPGPAGEVADGNDKATNFLTGQVMKLSRGKANPKQVTEMILAKLRG